MANTKIEWCDLTINVVSGCTPISPGCDNCYAKRMANRLAGRFGYPEGNGFAITLHPDKIWEAYNYRKPKRIFLNSMGDLFHSEVPENYIRLVFDMIRSCYWDDDAPKHTFIILTKRPERMLEVVTKWEINQIDVYDRRPLPNLWLGVTAENQEQADKRISILLQIPAAVRFVSVEPMLGPVNLSKYLPPVTPEDFYIRQLPDGRMDSGYRRKIDWVIVGGETGPGARPCHPDWVRSLRNQCQAADVPFFFKHWGEWAPSKPFVIDQAQRIEKGLPLPKKYMVLDSGLTNEDMKRDRGIRAAITGTAGITMAKVGKKAAGRLLDGRTWEEFPEVKA